MEQLTKDLRKMLALGTGVGIEIGAADLEVAVARVRFARVQVRGRLTIANFAGRPAAEWGAEYARFLKGVALADSGKTDDAIAVYLGLVADFPELPEVRNNLAVLYGQKGNYEGARDELTAAILAAPDYAIAYENLGDVYARLAGAEYDRALALDKTNKSAQTKLALVRELYAVAPSTNAPKPVVPKPAPVKDLAPPKPKK